MNHNTGDIIAILQKRLQQIPLSAAEQTIFEQWLQQTGEQSFLLDGGPHEQELMNYIRLRMNDAAWQKALQQFRKNAFESGQATTGASVGRVHRVHFLKKAWLRYAAAVLLLLAGMVIYFSVSKKPRERQMAGKSPQSAPAEIQPGSNKAVLTLSNGKKVPLNQAAAETIRDGDLSIENKNGQLIYTGNEVVGTNTMSTPKGGQYRLVLSDGTQVWLNAASSITYPVAFTGNTREVTITGEVYFDVKKDKGKRFIVKTHQDIITVFGTQFNVHAYAEEGPVKTTLVEGSVKVGDTRLQPGEAYQNGKTMPANVQQDIAWKNGLFNFEKCTLSMAVRQLARWYDVEPVYEKDVPDIKIWGSMDRRLTLNQVVETLRDMQVNCRIEGRKLIIAP